MKKIFIMRHGQAQNLAEQDKLRQLTDLGRAEAQYMADLFSEKVRFDAIISSTYTRAIETAEIMASCQQVDYREQFKDFVPEGDAINAALLIKALIETKPELDNWLIVAHMPIVSYLVDAFCPLEMPIFNTAAICELAYDQATENASIVAMTLPDVLGNVSV